MQLELEKLKERALTPPRPPVIQMPPAPGADWIGVVRLALRAARAVEINPYLFTPRLSFSERICTAARFLRHVQRTQAYLRHAQKTKARGSSR
jgi:hypothetical protein